MMDDYEDWRKTKQIENGIVVESRDGDRGDVMCIVLNKCVGRFDLSQRAIEMCYALNDEKCDWIVKNYNNMWSIYSTNYEKLECRTDPALIYTLEKIGKRAFTPLCNLEIVNVAKKYRNKLSIIDTRFGVEEIRFDKLGYIREKLGRYGDNLEDLRTDDVIAVLSDILSVVS